MTRSAKPSSPRPPTCSSGSAPGPRPGPRGGEGESLHELGRCFHTLKGAAGSVGIDDLATPGSCTSRSIRRRPGQRPRPALIDLLASDPRLSGRPARLAAGRGRPRPVGARAEAESPLRSRSMLDPAGAGPLRCRRSQPGGRSRRHDGLVRIPSSRIDELMDLVSELIAQAAALDRTGRVDEGDRGAGPDLPRAG